MSYLFLAILLIHLGQVSSGTLTIIGGNDRIKGDAGKSVTMKWRAICDVGEHISIYSIYLPGNEDNKDVSGTIEKQRYSNLTYGILKDRLQLLYFPVDGSNYQLGGEFHLTLKDLKLNDKHNFTLRVLFSELMANSRLSSINVLSWIAIQRVTGGPFGCVDKAIRIKFGDVPDKILVEEDTAASVIFEKDICVRGYPKPFIKYKFTGSEFIAANSDVKKEPSRDQGYQFSKFTTRKLISSDCGKDIQFQFIGYQKSREYGGPKIRIKFTNPVIHSMLKQTTNGKTSFTWEVKDIGKCEISGYTATVKKSDGTEVNYSINSRIRSFTLPSEDIRKIKVKALFTDSKTVDDSNYWYDVHNPVDPVTPKESSSTNGALIGVIVAVSVTIILVMILIVWLLKRRNKSDNTTDMDASENQRLHPAEPNEYVQMPVKSKPEKQENIVYDVVGIGGGRVPGSAPAQPTNRTPQQSHYSEVKTDEMGYPVTR